jgi:hypothetical protein
VNLLDTVRARALSSLGCVALLAAVSSRAPMVVHADGSGVLTITAPGTLTLPALVDGSTTADTNLGSLSWTDTMNDGVGWSVTLAATNLWHAAGAGLYIPWACFTITVDPVPIPDSMDTGPAVAVPTGSPYVLAGAPTTDFATYSTPITLATGSSTSQGTWTADNNQIAVAVPANTTPSTSFAGTIQYTLTG